MKYPKLRPLTVRERFRVLQNRGLARKEASRIAYAMACRYEMKCSRALSQFFDQLIGAAMWGLCVAAQRYDHSRGVTFATFAWPVIRSAVGQASRKARLRELRFSDRPRYNPWTGDVETLGETWDHRGQPEPETALPVALVRALAAVLGPRNLRIFLGYTFGGKGQKELGAEEGITKARAQQILAWCRKKLQGDPEFLEELHRHCEDKRQSWSRVDFGGTNVATPVA